MYSNLATTKLRINDPTKQLYIFISVQNNLIFVGSLVDWIDTIKVDFVGDSEEEVLNHIIVEYQKTNPPIVYTAMDKMKDSLESLFILKRDEFQRIKEEIVTQEKLNSIRSHEEENLQKNRFKANDILFEIAIIKKAIQNVKTY